MIIILYNYLQKTQEILFEAKNAGGEKLKYSCRGVGGDHTCGLQVTIDGSACVTQGNNSHAAGEHPGAHEFLKHILEFSTNTLRISVTEFRNMSEIFDVVKAGKSGFVSPSNAASAGTSAAGAALGSPTPYVPIVSACSLRPIPSDVIVDDFVVDLAIGIGATQLHIDGLYALDTSSKIQRLQTIVEETSSATRSKTSANSLRLPFVGGKFHTMHT